MASIKDEQLDFGEVEDDDELIINLPTEDYQFEEHQASNNNNNNNDQTITNRQVTEVITIDDEQDARRRSPRKKMRISTEHQTEENNESGWSDIHSLSFKGNLDGVRQLLDSSPQLLEMLDSNKRTPLYVAAARGKTRVVELLAQKGASIEHLNDKGYTPLFAASMYGHVNTVKLLVKLGATTQTKCLHTGYQKEFTAEDLEIAHEEHKSACTKFLKSSRERQARTAQLEASISTLEQQLENQKRELQTLKNNTDP